MRLRIPLIFSAINFSPGGCAFSHKHPLERAPKQPDCETAAKTEPHQHQEIGFMGHPFPKCAEESGKIVAEEAGEKPDAHLNYYFRLVFELRISAKWSTIPEFHDPMATRSPSGENATDEAYSTEYIPTSAHVSQL